jgi:mannose-1-phosphate guanylyltransferase
MKAMLLAAGKSTRLGALGRALPKPLVPVCGHPAVAFGLAACVRAGLSDVVINLFHHGDLLRSALGTGAVFGARIQYSQEVELLGTGGGIAQARTLLGEGPVLVMNAKVVADVDLGAVVQAHLGSGADATLVLRDVPDAVAWGAITADATGRVVGILDQKAPGPASGAIVERMFTGIQIMGPAVRDRLRAVFSDSVREGYMPALRDGADIRAFVLPGYFAEHSTPARYLAGNLALLRAPQLLAHPPGPLSGVDPGARIEAGARVVPPVRVAAGAVVETGATIGPDVVVGAGATVAAGARLERTIVWAGLRATGTITDAVVTPDGVVAAG